MHLYLYYHFFFLFRCNANQTSYFNGSSVSLYFNFLGIVGVQSASTLLFIIRSLLIAPDYHAHRFVPGVLVLLSRHKSEILKMKIPNFDQEKF